MVFAYIITWEQVDNLYLNSNAYYGVALNDCVANSKKCAKKLNAEFIEIKIPEEHQYIKEKSVVAKAHMKWQQILCKTNTTPGLVMRLQKILKLKKYNPGKIDGNYGADTRKAVNQYQRDKGIPSGALTLETLQSLNLI